MAKVIIGCKLPNGLTLTHPGNKEQKVTLAGLNKAPVIGATHVITEVDQDFWEAWKKAYSDENGKPTYQPLASGAIFEAKNSTDAAAKGKELAGEKTGLEPMDREAHLIKPADKE